VTRSNLLPERKRLWPLVVQFGQVLRRRLPWRPNAQIVALAIGLVLWEIVARIAHFTFLPPFSAVLRSSFELIQRGVIFQNLLASLASLAIGYSAAAGLGVLLGALMGRYRKVEYFFDLYLSAFLASPTLIWVPVLFALFGVSRVSQGFLIFLYAFWLIVANTLTGIRTVDPALVEMSRSFMANERQLFWRVMLPGALPLIMAGLRVGMGRAIKGMVNGEMFIALIGLGALIKRYGSQFRVDYVLGILLVIVIVALILSNLIQWLDKRLTRWAD
jgi:NitT/TauT family transport system permease protein